MYTIEKETCHIIEIKKSKFICLLYPIDNKSEALKYLEKAKSIYKDATHICYAYIIKQEEKYSDDGEPNGTAGLPILDILKKKKLYNTIAIVIRYFGGVKLGAGNLLRTYKNVTLETIKMAKTIKYIEYETITIKAPYNLEKTLNNICKDLNIIEKKFDANIIYKIKIDKKEKNDFLDKINHLGVKLL